VLVSTKLLGYARLFLYSKFNRHLLTLRSGSILWLFVHPPALPLVATIYQEELEDTKGVIRFRISKKSSQHNDQKKRYKRTNNDLQNIHTKL